jgi:small subunit ribosomal protein S2
MRNPWMSQYIYGHRLDVDIIDLNKTLPMLHSALNFLAHIAYRQGVILFLTRYSAYVPLVERAVRNCGKYAHCRKWDYPFINTLALFEYDIRLPDVCIFTHILSPRSQPHPAISASNKLLIPTVALCDTYYNVSYSKQ